MEKLAKLELTREELGLLQYVLDHAISGMINMQKEANNDLERLGHKAVEQVLHSILDRTRLIAEEHFNESRIDPFPFIHGELLKRISKGN